MTISRREVIAGAVGATIYQAVSSGQVKEQSMYGLIGKFVAVEGQRDALIAILIESTTKIPGCLSYIVAKDSSDENGIWITEVWDTKASHDASLAMPEVKKAIAAGRPLIAGFGGHTTTTPVGGYGLPSSAGH